MEGMRGRSVEMILKELAMAAIAYNQVLQVGLPQESWARGMG